MLFEGTTFIHTIRVQSRPKANFSLQFMARYVWYSMEKLAGDLLFGLKLVKLSILPMLFIQLFREAWEN